MRAIVVLLENKFSPRPRSEKQNFTRKRASKAKRSVEFAQISRLPKQPPEPKFSLFAVIYDDALAVWMSFKKLAHRKRAEKYDFDGFIG